VGVKRSNFRRSNFRRSNFRRSKQEVEIIAKLFWRLKVSFCKIAQEIEKALGGYVRIGVRLG
jgi:hypothetical protein